MAERSGLPVPGGDLERALLAALWERGQATARELHEDVGASRGIVYTTVAKVLDRMEQKQLVSRGRAGRAYIYQACEKPSATRRALARSLLAQLVDVGHRPAVAALLGAMEDLSPDLLEELAQELRARRREGR